ncbi:MAG: class I SAM-dependent methyltransferase [Oscillospiraceae bacterium]|jgi:ubiquinone/menaquinone biosynthesis C-methylase UbiE|nr:class I SAM-dependent methyltransferase [Oscillospiraceae bacterium]
MSDSGYAALAHFYDIFTKNMDYKKRTEVLCALLCHAGVKPGGTILDLACGTGTYTCALQRRGYDMVGVDASPDMLQIAREKAQALNLTMPLLLCQRMEDLDLYGTAQAAICLTDSLNHLARPAQARNFFRRLALFLEPGAPFVFDVNTPYKHERVLADNTFVYEDEGAFCAWQNHWDAQARTTQIDLDIFMEGGNGFYTRAQERFAERAYAPEELTRWLGEAGFAVEHIYEELTEQPPPDTAERIFFVCRRT